MGVYSKVVSTARQIDTIHTFVEGVRKDITSGWVFIDGVRKQVFPTTEAWELVFEQLTPGTYTFNVGFGKYRIEMSAGGGGGATALAYQVRTHCGGASGGTGAYGTVSLEYDENTTDTITIIVGSHGNGATKIEGTAASTGGGATKLSDTTHGTEFVVLGGGTRGYAHATSNGDTAYVGSGGTFTTTLTDHDLHNGRNGASATTDSGHNHVQGNTTNPDPYSSYGQGGGYKYYPFDNTQAANNGTDGFVRIYKSNIYPE